MSTREKLRLARRALLCCSLLSAASCLLGQTGETGPRYEISGFGGVQNWSVHYDPSPFYKPKLVDGAIFGGRFVQDFSNHVGMEESFTYGINNLKLPVAQGPGDPFRTVSFGARNIQVMVGPVFYFTPRNSRFRPFVTAGPAYQYFYPTGDAKDFARRPENAGLNASRIEGRYGPAGVAGGGLKFTGRRLLLRLDVRGIWAQNPHFALSGAPGAPGSVYIQNGGYTLGAQATLGIGFRFGEKAPPPVAVAPPPPPPEPPKPEPAAMTVSLAASSTSVCEGDTVTLTPTLSVPAGTPATYQWTINNESVKAAESLQFPTTGRPAGSYRFGVAATSANFQPASATTTVEVRAYRAPSGAVQAQPAEVYLGEKTTLSANFTNECGGPIRSTTYTVTEGSIDGNVFDPTGVQFDPAEPGAEQRRNVTITALARDDKSSGQATAVVAVKKRAAPVSTRLPDLIFARGDARVNNCGKRLLLEQLKTYRDQDPAGRIVLVGHASAKEGNTKNLDRRRASNAAAVVSAGSGICLNIPADQVLIVEAGTSQDSAPPQPFFCGTSTTPKTEERRGQAVASEDTDAALRRVEVWFVPGNGVVPASAQAAKAASTYNIGALGCPR